MPANLDPIQDRLRATLPEAHVQATAVPGLRDLHLALINADFSTAPLAPETMRAVIANPAYWAFCWGSGLATAIWLQAEPQLVTGKVVADIGCGSGIVAIAASLAGAREVFACDIDEDALLATQINAELNGCEVKLCQHVSELPEHLDQVWMADVLYDRSNLPLIQKVKDRAQSVFISDSRVSDVEDPEFEIIHQAEALTFPNLGEFDEFRQVRFFHCQR